jgi:hypothetical protein
LKDTELSRQNKSDVRFQACDLPAAANEGHSAEAEQGQ